VAFTIVNDHDHRDRFQSLPPPQPTCSEPRAVASPPPESSASFRGLILVIWLLPRRHWHMMTPDPSRPSRSPHNVSVCGRRKARRCCGTHSSADMFSGGSRGKLNQKLKVSVDDGGSRRTTTTAPLLHSHGTAELGERDVKGADIHSLLFSPD
jgi:hypothetical protein